MAFPYINLIKASLLSKGIVMRNLLITKWIQETNQEIEKAKQHINYTKLIELRRLRNDLLLLRDGQN
jgi:hypothetical protein